LLAPQRGLIATDKNQVGELLHCIREPWLRRVTGG
jgi:hypothetical protein